MNANLILTLFPIVFMIHEFEELIMVENWLQRHRDDLFRRFPNLAERLERLVRMDTRSFTVIVAEEFMIVSCLTVISMITGNIIYWYCALAAFSIHLLVHLLQFMVWRKYIPAVITTLFCMPYCILALREAIQILNLSELALYAVLGTAAAGANLLGMHRLLLKTTKQDDRRARSKISSR